MECTQRIECTQDVYETYSERTYPEQIGFLGICGSKQPVIKGPNKIGRDPQTCSIVLDDNSISRQHAVINILNKKDFMLMDLDSSNKTKLLGKILQPYIPHPLKDGDTVQFGQVFGIFRLIEEDDDLPMTQALEIPETPINIRQVSRLKTVPITTVPESPDVSDRDDSIIAQSQPKKKTDLRSPNNNFIKSSGKIIGLQNKIDNVYWNSSKKSDSFSSNFESNSSYTVNKTSVSPKKLSIKSSIYDMETQDPTVRDIDQISNSIYEANTQIPSKLVSPNIYSCETQLPNIEKLPEVFKVTDQSNVRLNLYSTNENFNIFEAETQVMLQNKQKSEVPTLSNAISSDSQNRDAICSVNKKLNSSDEEICFVEIDCPQYEDECGSQPLLPPDPSDFVNVVTPITNPQKTKNPNTENGQIANDAVLYGPDSKHCEGITSSRVVLEKHKDDGDVTDCEDNMLELAANVTDHPNIIKSDDDLTDCEEDLNNVKRNDNQKTTDDNDLTDCEDDVIEISQNRSKVSNLFERFEDMPAQIIEEGPDGEKKPICEKDDVPFEEMLTQVIEECPIESNENAINNTDNLVTFEDLQTEVIAISKGKLRAVATQIENNNSFKRPHSLSIHKKGDKSLKISKSKTILKEDSILQNNDEDDQNYYDATQQILNDLCTQNEQLNKLPGAKIENTDLPSKKNMLIRERSSDDSDATEVVNSFVSNLSKEQVREVIGAVAYVPPLSKKNSSDNSDLEVTPKKFNCSKFLMIDLPNSQEIKSCDFVTSKIPSPYSSDDLEDTEEQDNNNHSPLIGSHRRRKKKDIKVDLMKKFDINTLPTRAITRIRKPTSKLLNSDSSTKKLSVNILQSKLGLDKEHEIDGEVIQLNLKKLRSKMEKAENKRSNSSTKSSKDNDHTSSKRLRTEQVLQHDDKKESKEQVLLQRSNKELKQQNIKTMFKESNSKDVTAVDTSISVNTKSESSHKSRRSARNKSKGDKKEVTKTVVQEVNSESCERKKSSSRTHSSRKQVKEIIDLTKDHEVVVRRSRRHQTKEKIEEKTEKLRRNNDSNKSEKLHTVTSENRKTNVKDIEHSAVYNLSTETAVDSPPNLKRQATADTFYSKSKRTKPSNAGNASVRATPLRGIRTQHVLFTAFPSEEVKVKLEKLGAVIASDVKSCTVVLTLQLRRTFKLLCALGLGKPIVGPNWVQACADSNMIVDPWLYLIKDEATEKRFGFNLRQALTCNRSFLKGYNVSSTPNVSPNAREMKSIVECSGGTWKEGGRNWFCVSCPADKALWHELRKRGATLVSSEFILGGVLQQRINLDRDKLR